MPVMTDCPTVIGVLSMHLNYEKEDLPIGDGFMDQGYSKYQPKEQMPTWPSQSMLGDLYCKYNLRKERLFIAPLGFNSMISKD